MRCIAVLLALLQLLAVAYSAVSSKQKISGGPGTVTITTKKTQNGKTTSSTKNLVFGKPKPKNKCFFDRQCKLLPWQKARCYVAYCAKNSKLGNKCKTEPRPIGTCNNFSCKKFVKGCPTLRSFKASKCKAGYCVYAKTRLFHGKPCHKSGYCRRILKNPNAYCAKPLSPTPRQGLCAI